MPIKPPRLIKRHMWYPWYKFLQNLEKKNGVALLTYIEIYNQVWDEIKSPLTNRRVTPHKTKE